MRTSPHRAVRLLAFLLPAVVVAGCGGGDGGTPPEAASTALTAQSFAAVCAGTGVTRATAYDASAGAAAHRAVLLSGEAGSLTDVSDVLPKKWTIQDAASSADAYDAVDLVVCAERTDATRVKACKGFTDAAGKKTRNKVVIYVATYDVTVREAATAATLGTSTVVAHGKKCPTDVAFTSTDDVVQRYDELRVKQAKKALLPSMRPKGVTAPGAAGSSDRATRRPRTS